MIRKVLLPLLAAGGLLAATALPAAGPAPNGEALFRQRCASCHNMTPGARAVLAPSLIGVANRKAGATQFNYSAALKASNVTWNQANLDRYIAAPGRMVPGTRMVISVSDPAQRSAIIRYIVSRPAS